MTMNCNYFNLNFIMKRYTLPIHVCNAHPLMPPEVVAVTSVRTVATVSAFVLLTKLAASHWFSYLHVES